MAGVATQELSRADTAFSGNLLLSTLEPEARALLEPYGTLVELKAGETVLRRGENVESSLFPFGSTMVSMVVEMSGRSVEVASIGRGGAIGGIVSCGHAPAFSLGKVQVAGQALSLPMSALEDAKNGSPFISNIFCRYSDYLLAQVMQSVACNAFHTIIERAARWLLTAQDRAGDRLELTQGEFAGLLGVQRTTLNAVIATLEEDGLIETRRGVIRVRDRAGLKRRACPCYEAVKSHFASVIGTSGRGV